MALAAVAALAALGLPAETIAAAVQSTAPTGGYVGISPEPLKEGVAESLGIAKNRGELIRSVTPDGPASRAGIQQGDVVITVNNQPVTSDQSLASVLSNLPIGSRVPIELIRGNQRNTLTVTIAERPTNLLYGGGYGVPGNFYYSFIDLLVQGDNIRGTLRQPYQRTDEPKLQNLIRGGDSLRFDVDRMHFDLTRWAHGYTGWMRDARGRRQRAYFIDRPVPNPPEIVENYVGTYRLPNGHLLTVSQTNMGSNIFYLELPSGRTGFLYNLSETEFMAGPCYYCAGPEYLRLNFPAGKEGRAQTVRVRTGGREMVGQRLTSYREEEVRFTSPDGTQLAGSLLIPVTPGPHYAVVFAHGSNAQARNGYFGNIRFIAEAYARSGIAALVFDKRGTGRSKGDWETADFDVLADDVAAGVRYLRTRSDIRPDRIGLTGSSQAGWIMSLASTRVPDVRFIQMRSSSPMSVREADRDQLVLMMETEGYPRSEIQRALDIRDMMDDYAVTGQNWEQLEAAAKQVENEYWMSEFIGGLPAKDAPDHAWLRKAFSYDTTAAVRNFKGAWQAIYGARDTVVSVPKTRLWLEDALRYSRSNDVTIEVVPNADHDYYEAKTGLRREFPGYTRYVPGIFDKITRWANERMRNRYTHRVSTGKTHSR
jgi:dienelactone hydrolase